MEHKSDNTVRPLLCSVICLIGLRLLFPSIYGQIYQHVKNVNWLTLLFFGALLGWLIAAILRNFERPDLVISKLEDSQNTNPGTHKFLCVEVENVRRGWLKRILYGERASLSCYARVDYYLPNQQDPKHTLNGRWASTGEPVFQGPGGIRYFQYNKLPELRFESILPGMKANLAVAIKVNGDLDCYAFDNESYIFMNNGFRDPGKTIAHNTRVVVTLCTSDGYYPKATFYIRNPNNGLDDFVLD